MTPPTEAPTQGAPTHLTCWAPQVRPTPRRAFPPGARAERIGVLALIGRWDSGKSSVLQMAIQHLRNVVGGAGARVWSVAEPNPWMYSDLESLTPAPFSKLRAALPSGNQWSELPGRPGRSARRSVRWASPPGCSAWTPRSRSTT
ncbi:P-loop NTPase fold protein [Streptomyces olivaceus]|uniref:P-loop NTPase fold protein n=1 Tax=Streptomyces olivaceus TaxID=47716 RepID=UPI00355604C4